MRFRLPDRLKYYWWQRKQDWRKCRWAIVARRRSSFVTRLQPDLRIRLYGDSELCRLIYCRHFEAVERDFVNRFLRPGDTFVDVGANIGLFTLIAASRVGPSGKVIAFEPTLETYERLVENVRLNCLSNVDCVRSGLSDHTGELELVRSIDGFDAWNSFAAPTMGRVTLRERVSVIEWDRYAEAHRISGGGVTMIKIDVEGWESKVLCGGESTLSRPDAPVLQVEFTDDAALAAGSSCRALYELLESFGYQLYVYDTDRRRLVRDPLRDRYPYANLLAVKDCDFVNRRLGESSDRGCAQRRGG